MNTTQPALFAGPSTAPTFLDERRGSAALSVAQLDRGGRIVGMTMGQFSLLDIISACLERTGPADVWLSTWTAGIRDVESVGLMLDSGRIRSMRLLVDRSFATRQPAYCAAVRRVFGDDAIRATNTHAKVAIVRGGGWDITIRSSMNLNRNSRVEQFDIDDSKPIADFFAYHFDEMGAAMPPGPHASSREVDAVFSRVRRGRNPFTAPQRQALEKAGVPFGSGFLAWAKERIHAPKGPGLKGVAKEVGLSASECWSVLISNDPDESVIEEIAAFLL